MKFRIPQSRYRFGLIASLLLITGPILLMLFLNLPNLVYPNDCDTAGRCEHAISEIAGSLAFGLIFLGPLSMLLGALILVAMGLIWGLHAFKQNRTGGSLEKYFKKFLGITCFGIFLFFLYIPGEPDQCSRVVTDTQYEVCLEDVFAGMTTSEVRQWLVSNGFTVGRVIESNPEYSRSRDPRHASNSEYNYDFHFQAFRDFGKFRSVPYGTNFNRFFARVGPAPDRFELNLYGDRQRDVVVAVDVWWAFTFL